MAEPPSHPNDTQPQRRLGKGMVYGAWVLALVLLTWVFAGWLDTQRNPNRHVRTQVLDGTRVLTLERNRYGHYHAAGHINGQEVEFMVDTGATTVAVPASLEQRLGLQRQAPVLTETANGTVTAYLTRLDSVRLGDIEVREVKATIHPQLEGNEVLLGMSFLKHLDFNQRGDLLILQQPSK
jgi:aspartyl protease family protein